jgi:LmbE family N-acetylglucosaminyl deacetylase
MTPLAFAPRDKRLSVLCVGAHSDDVEIGAGGTLMSLIDAGIDLNVLWCVASAPGARGEEAYASARDFLTGVAKHTIELAVFDDSYFPTQSRPIKEWLARMRSRFQPDLVFTHRRDDAHQDHRTINEITWNVFRDHTILEYEIPKWDGDLGQPNFYVPLSEKALAGKIELLMRHFASQRSKDWFDPETFKGLARLRGMECRAETGYAEAFVVRKARLGF